MGFYRKYRTPYHLADELNLADFERSLARGFEGASEALGSQKQKQIQKQDLETETETIGSGKEKKDAPVSNSGPQSHPAASSPAPKPNPYEAAQNGDDGSSGMFTAFEVPTSSDIARRFLIGKGVPGSMLDGCVNRMMAGKFSPYDLEGMLDRGAA